MDGYVVKPITKGKLEATIARFMPATNEEPVVV